MVTFPVRRGAMAEASAIWRDVVLSIRPGGLGSVLALLQEPTSMAKATADGQRDAPQSSSLVVAINHLPAPEAAHGGPHRTDADGSGGREHIDRQDGGWPRRPGR